MTFVQKSSPTSRVTYLIIAYEQLKNAAKIIGYNEALWDVMEEVELLIDKEVELENEQLNFQEVECD
tara:strand:- start:226 stop:426 length:201 start_codon:yes stop_codon:yes gene_type:complete